MIDQVILGDCRKILENLEEEIDLVLTDPPWMISSEVIIHRSKNPKKYKYTGKDIKLDFGEWDHFKDEKHYLEFTHEWMEAVFNVLRAGGHLVTFFDQHRSTQLINIARDLGYGIRQHLYWLKSNPVPRARKVDFMVALEHALWLTKEPRSKATFNYELGQQANYVRAPIVHHTRRRHPTQKPISVLKIWISYLSNPGDLVLDPFCGSGSTLVAAKQLNRHLIGIEKGLEYYELAKKWVEETQGGLGLL